jgi:hypothetical protein
VIITGALLHKTRVCGHTGKQERGKKKGERKMTSRRWKKSEEEENETMAPISFTSLDGL